MYINYTAHSPSTSLSCTSLIEYLDKENQIENSKKDIKSLEYFFNSDYDSINSEQELKTQDVIHSIDNNRGSQKLSSSNFFMINISPSPSELKHMENIAVETLSKKGIRRENNPPASELFFDEQKEQLMKMQIKLYTKDLMVEYANNFNREIYCNENGLPNESEKKILKAETEIKFSAFLKDNNIDLELKKESIPNESKKWIATNNIQILEDKGKSYLVELDLKEKGKAEILIPKDTLQIQKDTSFKIPENLYNEKVKEVIAKNTFKEVDYSFKNISTVKINKIETKVMNFEFKDKRFKEPLSFSIQESDVKVVDGKKFVSEHLLNQKKEYALKNNIEKEFGNEKEKIYNTLATEKGFDVSKRPLTEKDLLWYGKIENSRAYHHTDKSVKINKEILSKIALENKAAKPNKEKIKLLQSDLVKDKETNKVIMVGDTKGGNQYHAHVVVSRNDKTMQNPRNKMSLSPLSNAKESEMSNGAKVGFDRDAFAQKAEKVFDEKFNFDRPASKSYEAYKKASKSLAMAKSEIKGKAKQFVMKHTGLNEIKRNISPVQNIKQELGVANIPTQLPKSVADLAVKIAVKVVKKVIGKGLEY
jgi:Family of unknown function (DUF5712)